MSARSLYIFISNVNETRETNAFMSPMLRYSVNSRSAFTYANGSILEQCKLRNRENIANEIASADFIITKCKRFSLFCSLTYCLT